MKAGDFNTDQLPSVSWFVGTCGISNPQWVENFYPRGVHSRDRLAYYASRFNSIELNTTFHAIPQRSIVQRWREVTPPAFRFCLKFPEDITHGEPENLLRAATLKMAAQFFSVAGELGEKLAMMLMQFPWSFSACNRPMLLRFIDQVHTSIPIVVEFRNDNWRTPATEAALRERNIGWATADLAGLSNVADVLDDKPIILPRPRQLVVTTDSIYLRLLGKHHQFRFHTEEYSDSTTRLNWWFDALRRVLKISPGVRRVFVFFDDDFSGHAPTAARRFADIVNLPRTFQTISLEPNQLCLPFAFE